MVRQLVTVRVARETGNRSSETGLRCLSTTVLATIDMLEYWSVNMYGIEEFDSVVSDPIVHAIEGFEYIDNDFGNLEVKNQEEP